MMKPVAAIVAPGNMGAAVAKLLVDHGVKVLTTLEGRSAASEARAAAAGMAAVAPEHLVKADFLLSILPPGRALAFAEQMAPALRNAQGKPLFVDCNAVGPATVERMREVIEPTGAPFVDASIIGLPPVAGRESPHIYASGRYAPRVEALRAYGLDVRVLNGPVGAASVLKMCYAGINKGVTAVATAMILAATRSGAAPALRQEMSESLPELLSSLSHLVPDMLPKAYRWVAEMQEIARFTGDDPAAASIFTAFAELYGRISHDQTGDRRESAQLRQFFSSEDA
jgi:3-hydroxyisobutyrate dehydrogenase-like beta-hydroxyacid dehydrogenase